MTTGDTLGEHRPGEHGPVGEELRLLALALLDRYEPRVQSVLAGLRVEAAEAAAAGGTDADADGREPACQWCPLCATIAVFRGDRPELGGRVAEHAGGLLAALRTVLEQPAEAAPSDAAQQPPDRTPPVVQHIEVRDGRDGSMAGGGC